jgi:hypothetical protein
MLFKLICVQIVESSTCDVVSIFLSFETLFFYCLEFLPAKMFGDFPLSGSKFGYSVL